MSVVEVNKLAELSLTNCLQLNCLRLYELPLALAGGKKDVCFIRALAQTKFGWQDEYFVVSVSDSIVDKVREYIRKQEAHHRRQTFSDEFDDFLVKAGFQRFADLP